MADHPLQIGEVLNGLHHDTADQDHPPVRPTAESGPRWLTSELSPHSLKAIEAFEQSSFKVTYLLIGLAGLGLAMTLVVTALMILLAGK
jgi:hypothetical protein